MDGGTAASLGVLLFLVTVLTVEAGVASYPGVGDLCSRVRCAAPPCPNPVRDPQGGCCMICPKRPDCSLVDCFPLKCANQITPPDQCCPICVPVIKGCRVGRKLYREGETIPSKDPCRPCTCRQGRMSCDSIACIAVWCPGHYTVPGQCCPVCPPGGGAELM